MNQQPEQPSVRRIVLPSGRSIEVVRFGENTHSVRGLHVCPECRSDLVQPVAWEQVATGNEWRLWRRCPECEWAGDQPNGNRW